MTAVVAACALFAPASGSSFRAAATLTVCPGTAYDTIQKGVNAANPGDTIEVCAGTYTEQVLIPVGKNNLTLQSQTPKAAIIQAPPSLPATQSSAIVEVSVATGVTISGFTISGPGTGGCGTIGYGVLVDGGGSATVTGNHVGSIRDNPFSGCQNGVGIAAGCCLPTPGASPGSVTATGNLIDDYQKAGIDIRGTGSVGTISGNTIHGAGSTPSIAQNGIQVSRGASAAVTGNTVASNEYGNPAQNVATGILIVGPIGTVTVAQNKLPTNDVGVYVYKVATAMAVRANTATGGIYGVVVDGSSNVLVDKNTSLGVQSFGLYATDQAKGNTFQDNLANGSGDYDCRDESEGSATADTANTWKGNTADTARPSAICSPPPLEVDVPPVIVLPPTPGAAPPQAAGPVGQAVGNTVIASMKRNKLRSCVIRLTSRGVNNVLVARGFARVNRKGTGRMVIRVRARPEGVQLLKKHFGGVVVVVRATCRSTSNAPHTKLTASIALLAIEHVVTPPGSWVPDQPILTPIGIRFVHHLQRRMIAVLRIRCDGFTALYPPSPMFPPVLSLQRAAVVCRMLQHAGVSVTPRLVPHGSSHPIATNSTEAGRRVNRRVAVTFVHRVLIRRR